MLMTERRGRTWLNFFSNVLGFKPPFANCFDILLWQFRHFWEKLKSA